MWQLQRRIGAVRVLTAADRDLALAMNAQAPDHAIGLTGIPQCGERRSRRVVTLINLKKSLVAAGRSVLLRSARHPAAAPALGYP